MLPVLEDPLSPDRPDNWTYDSYFTTGPDVQIGDNPKFFTEFYQPLSLASRYFIAPSVDFEERSVFQLGGQGQDLLAEYRVRSLQGGLDLVAALKWRPRWRE